MAITFTGVRTLSSSAATLPWNNQLQASLRWKFLFSGDPTQTGDVRTIGRNGGVGVYGSLAGAGTAANTVKLRFTVRHADGSLLTNTAEVSIGVAHELCITHDGSAGLQTAWIDGTSLSLGTRTGNTQTGTQTWSLGYYGTAPGGGCVYTIDDVCAWDGYVLTSADVLALRNGGDPAAIGTGAAARYRWPMTIPGNKNPGDALASGEVSDSYGRAGLAITSLTGSGTSVWAPPIAWGPAVRVKRAWIGTSGRTVFVSFQTINGGNDTVPTVVNTTPTITRNGTSLGSLGAPLASGSTSYAAFTTPSGAVLQPGDVVTLDAPQSWATTAAGTAGAMAGQAVTIYTGRSAGFRPQGYKPTLRMGMNIDSGPTSNLAAGPYLRNLAKRLGAWVNVSASDANGKPTALSASPAYTGLVNSPTNNGLDATDYPGPIGLFAVGWDDLDPVHPTTFELYSADPTISTVTERLDLKNSGVNGVGQVRVFNVQRAGLSTRTFIRVRMSNASLSPRFDNLVIHGPGDFIYTDNQPVMLDRSDPNAFSDSLLDRLKNTGSLRCYSPLIGTSKTHIAEWDQSRQIGDFGYGDGTTKVTLTQRFTRADAYNPATWPWVYSPTAGSKYPATLAAPINTAPAAGTVETITVSDAATAPVIVGLRLFVDSEVLRVRAVNGTAVTVERGCHGTKPATHEAGAIQVGYRFASPPLGSGSLSKGTWHILTTQDPHGLVSGQPIWPRGSGWPQTTPCTNSVTMYNGINNHSDWTGMNSPVMVTGPSTVLWQGGPSDQTGAVIADPNGIVLDPANAYATRDYPESAMVPYGVHAKLADAVRAKAVWYSVPFAATDDFAWQAAREARDNLRPGHEVWLELGNEVWHFQPAFTHFLQMSSALYPGQAGLAYYAKRAAEVAAIWRAAFDEGGRNRSGEIRLFLNLQAVYPAGFASLLTWCAGQSPPIKLDGVAIAPYIDWTDTYLDTATVNYLANLDIDQAVDLWIHSQWYQPATSSSGLRRYAVDWSNLIATYNSATGFNCQLLGYEGGLETIFVESNYPSTSPRLFAQANWNERRRDFAYHPNLYVVMQDWFALLEQIGFKQFNYFDLDNPVNLPGSGQYLWGIYKGYQQPHGRGDGSDSKADNRLCVAEPSKAVTKVATISLDATNVSVMGQAWLDWNLAAITPRRPKFALRSFHGR